MATWDASASAYPPARHQALALWSVAAVAVAAACGASLSPAVRCSVRTFLLLSVALWTAGAVVHTSSRVRNRITRRLQSSAAATSFPALLFAAAAAVALSIGSFGIVAAASQRRATKDTDATQPPAPMWPLAIATAIAVAWIVVACVLVVMALLTAVRSIQPDQETPPAILLLRCSCCSFAVKRLMLVLPLAALSATSLVLWRQARAHGSGCALAQQPTQLLVGAVAVFGSMAAALVVTFAYQWGTRRAEVTHKHRRRVHAMTLLLLLMFGAAAMAWAVECGVWLHSHHLLIVASASHETALCGHIRVIYRSVQLTTGALFTVAVLLLTATCCCRLERHLLHDTTSAPSVDLSMLSPHAIRPPTLLDQAV